MYINNSLPEKTILEITFLGDVAKGLKLIAKGDIIK